MTRDGGRQLALVLALILTCEVWSARAQQNIDFARLELQTVKVADGLYVLMGGPAQGNIAVSIGDDGVFLVDSIAAAIKAGKSEAEVIALKPTKDFDEGRMGGAITPDRFVSLVYADLSRQSK